MTSVNQRAYLKQLSASSPIKPWPIGMPCSAAPEVVAVGISYGNRFLEKKTRGSKREINEVSCQLLASHPIFYYPDTKHYWAKVRSLCCHFVRRSASQMSEDDCLALSSHLNLGTGQAGEAKIEDTNRAITRWVSMLLNKFFQPRLIVCFGLNQILKARFDDWNHHNGLQVDWRKPKAERLFSGYRFRLWEAISAKNKRIGILMWPNHPSRPPFAGDEKGLKWKRSLSEASLFLAENRF